MNLIKNAPNSQRGKHGKAGKIQERVPAGDYPLDERSRGIDQSNSEELRPLLECAESRAPRMGLGYRLLILDGEFLIVSVNYVLSSQGTLTTMTLSPKAAYELIPSDPDPTKDIGVYEQLRVGVSIGQG